MKTVLSNILLLCVFSFSANATPIFVDWASIDTSANVATGTLGSANVTLTGTNITGGIVDDSSSIFNSGFFSPSLTTSDFIGLRNVPSGDSFVLSFSERVANPIVHISGLATVIDFTGLNVTELSGNLELSNSAIFSAQRVNEFGSFRIEGVFDSLTFNTVHPLPDPGGLGESLAIHFGAEAVGVSEPATWSVLLAGGLILLARRRKTITGR